jgi:hypothetical protein
MRGRKKPPPMPRGWREFMDQSAPCRQTTNQCDINGECLRCPAANGETCLDRPAAAKEQG